MKEFVEKLIERLEELKEESIDKWDGGASHKAYVKAIEIINELAEEHKSNLSVNLTSWIPCSERLPGYGEKVLVFCPQDNNLYLVSRELAVYDEDVWENENMEYEDITTYAAWMPLPTPYNPEEPKQIPTEHFMERFNRVI